MADIAQIREFREFIQTKDQYEFTCARLAEVIAEKLIPASEGSLVWK